MRSANLIAVSLFVAVAGCKAESPSLQTMPGQLDLGTRSPEAIVPAPPSVTVPEVTPLSTVALRGSSPGASQVVVQTARGTNAVTGVLPNGSFCIDVPLEAGQVNAIKVFAAGNGKASTPVVVNVVQASTWPAPSKGTCTTSTGGEASSCDDPNRAACDPRCNGCPEDPYQPNFAPSQAPAIALRSSYPSLQLCPCRDDWFTFVLFKGQHITVQASYQKTTDFDLDLGLYRGADVLPQESGKPSIATTTAGTNGELATRTLDFTATAGGAYYLRVTATGLGVTVSTGAKARGSYSLVTESE